MKEYLKTRLRKFLETKDMEGHSGLCGYLCHELPYIHNWDHTYDFVSAWFNPYKDVGPYVDERYKVTSKRLELAQKLLEELENDC